MSLFKPTPASLRNKLEAAEGQRAELQDQLGRFALQAEDGGEAEQAALEQHRAAIAKAEQRAGDLQAALAAAEAEEQRNRAEQLAKLREKQTRAIAKHLRERDRAAEQVAKALALAVDAWREMVAASDEARKGAAAMGPRVVNWHRFADVARLFPQQMRNAITREITRLDGTIQGLPRNDMFPGACEVEVGPAMPPPKQWEPLPVELRQAGERALAMLRRELAGDYRAPAPKPEPASKPAPPATPSPGESEQQASELLGLAPAVRGEAALPPSEEPAEEGQ
jgi:hypothetical protein